MKNVPPFHLLEKNSIFLRIVIEISRQQCQPSILWFSSKWLVFDVISNRKINLSRKLLLSFPETQQPSNAEPATFNDSAFFMMKVMKVTFYKCSGTFLWNRFIVFFSQWFLNIYLKTLFKKQTIFYVFDLFIDISWH